MIYPKDINILNQYQWISPFMPVQMPKHAPLCLHSCSQEQVAESPAPWWRSPRFSRILPAAGENSPTAKINTNGQKWTWRKNKQWKIMEQSSSSHLLDIIDVYMWLMGMGIPAWGEIYHCLVMFSRLCLSKLSTKWRSKVRFKMKTTVQNGSIVDFLPLRKISILIAACGVLLCEASLFFSFFNLQTRFVSLLD